MKRTVTHKDQRTFTVEELVKILAPDVVIGEGKARVYIQSASSQELCLEIIREEVEYDNQ